MNIIHHKTWLLLLPLILLISGCKTPYQEEKSSGGYSEQQLSERSYMVSFRGNGYTPITRVQKYLMLRCAELTINNGYEYFLILEKEGEKSTTYVSDGLTYNAYAMDEHTKSAQIYMANKEQLSEEELKRAINAEMYWKNNKQEK